MSVDIICFGEPLMEFNQIRKGGNYTPAHGGDVSNCAVAAARQGASVGIIAHLGKDTFGDSFMNLWKNERIDTQYVKQSKSAHTGVYFTTKDNSVPTVDYLRTGSASSMFQPSNLSESYIATSKLLHISGIFQALSISACDSVFAAIQQAKAYDVRVSYDPNLREDLWPIERARAVIHATAALCDFFTPSYDDAVSLTGLGEPEEIIKFYHKLGVPVIALTLGATGVLVSTKEETRLIRGHRVKTADETAAGDVFNGAFLSQIIHDYDVFKAAEYANIAASLSVQKYGAVPSIPTYSEVAHAKASAQSSHQKLDMPAEEKTPEVPQPVTNVVKKHISPTANPSTLAVNEPVKKEQNTQTSDTVTEPAKPAIQILKTQPIQFTPKQTTATQKVTPKPTEKPALQVVQPAAKKTIVVAEAAPAPKPKIIMPKAKKPAETVETETVEPPQPKVQKVTLKPKAQTEVEDTAQAEPKPKKAATPKAKKEIKEEKEEPIMRDLFEELL